MRRDNAELDMDGVASPQVAYWNADVISGVAIHDLVARNQEMFWLERVSDDVDRNFELSTNSKRDSP